MENLPNKRKSIKKFIISIIIILLVFVIYLFISIAMNEKSVVNLGEIYVRVFTIEPSTIVKSPLEISGEARGNWFFEASFPIKIYDANGVLLGTAIAQAQGDWMTEDFVPFKTTLIFSTPTTATGEIVFKKDNPSGLSENDAEFRIPVKF